MGTLENGEAFAIDCPGERLFTYGTSSFLGGNR